MKSSKLPFLLLSLGLCLGCNGIQSTGKVSSVFREGLTTENGEPAYITVQHCLIGFQGSVPNANRTRVEAEKLALELLEQARGGGDFDAIIKEHTDDSPPGIYHMANRGFEADMNGNDPASMVFARDAMVPAFGDTGFPLQVGEYGLATFDQENSPFGWHIVKRLR